MQRVLLQHYFFPSVALLVLIFLSGCKKSDNNCISYSNAEVTKVEGEKVATVNQEIDLTISYYLYNGCGKFENLETTSSGNTTIINLKSKYNGCICTQELINGQTHYTFKAGQAGVYFLKFIQPEKTYLIDTIRVN